MPIYRYASVMSNMGGVRLICTDPQELDWIIKELKVFTDYRVSTPDKLISGEPYYYLIDKLKGRDRDVKWWIIKQLCIRGWEPLGATDHGMSSNIGDTWHYFRYSIPC